MARAAASGSLRRTWAMVLGRIALPILALALLVVLLEWLRRDEVPSAPAAKQSAINESMASASLGLLVVRTADITLSLSFYRALGLDFVEERHGSGPVHFSSDLGGVLLEIYPGEPGRAPERTNAGATLLGFRVGSIERALSALAPLSTRVLSRPVKSAWGRRAVVEDPDGRAIELREEP